MACNSIWRYVSLRLGPIGAGAPVNLARTVGSSVIATSSLAMEQPLVTRLDWVTSVLVECEWVPQAPAWGVGRMTKHAREEMGLHETFPKL